MAILGARKNIVGNAEMLLFVMAVGTCCMANARDHIVEHVLIEDEEIISPIEAARRGDIARVKSGIEREGVNARDGRIIIILRSVYVD